MNEEIKLHRDLKVNDMPRCCRFAVDFTANLRRMVSMYFTAQRLIILETVQETYILVMGRYTEKPNRYQIFWQTDTKTENTEKPAAKNQ